MATAIIMPRQGQSVESCLFGEWKKAVGDTVEIGDVLFSYETDKATFEEEAKVAGTLLAVLCEPGDDIPCLHTVAVIGEKGEDISSLLAENEEAAPEAPTSPVRVPPQSGSTWTLPQLCQPDHMGAFSSVMCSVYRVLQ